MNVSYQSLVAVSLSASILMLAGIRENDRVVEAYAIPESTREPEVIRIKTSDTYFSVPVFGTLEKTNVKIPFKFSGEPLLIWLHLQAEEGTPAITRLVSHPLLLDLNWNTITMDKWTLYQKTKQYKTIKDFLRNPPTQRFAADPQASLLKEFELEDFMSVSQLSSLEDVDFIFTTFKKPRVEDNYYIFSTTVDASKASKDNNQLSWHLQAPNIDPDSPYAIQAIHVDYD